MKKILSILLSSILAASALGISASARMLGDVDGSKTTNSYDALKILTYSVGSLDTINERTADVNCDGTINSSDALLALRISVNLYDGPTEVDLKPEVIDPIVKTGKYTFSTTFDTEDKNGNPETLPVTVMVNGKNICALMNYNSVDVRVLVLDQKVYMVIPSFMSYIEMPEDYVSNLDFSKITGELNQTYAGSFFATYDGKTYTVDTYKATDGSLSDYYFLDGKWAMQVKHSGKPEDAMKITDFKAGVNESYFSIKGLFKIDYSKLQK